MTSLESQYLSLLMRPLYYITISRRDDDNLVDFNWAMFQSYIVDPSSISLCQVGP